MLPPSLLPFRSCGNSGLAGGKNLEPKLLGLEALQPLEIPQNRQRIVWKSLERNSSDLEMLGKKLGASAGSDAPSREPRRGHAPRRPSLPGLRPAPRLERGLRVHHFGIFAVQVRERQRVHVF